MHLAMCRQIQYYRMIFSVAEQLQLPIRYIGVGETAEDLRPFDSTEFVDALLSELDGA